jgi:hypothetical protein
MDEGAAANPSERAAIALEEVTGHLPDGGERRPGQEAMARAVAEVLDAGGHLAYIEYLLELT